MKMIVYLYVVVPSFKDHNVLRGVHRVATARETTGKQEKVRGFHLYGGNRKMSGLEFSENLELVCIKYLQIMANSKILCKNPVFLLLIVDHFITLKKVFRNTVFINYVL